MAAVVATGADAFFGYFGVSAALVFANVGAAYGTARSGIGIGAISILKPELIMRSIVPVVMAGILGIYGMIVSVILCQKITYDNYSRYTGISHLTAGLCCGLSSLASGYAIGIVGDYGVRANSQQPRIFVGMILMLIFAEAIGLYGLIVSLILSSS
mmetsp:Transcript_66263/g.76902  ORF Transcript_66263/g.76902 Transcript_66263/m.76902 type:complete len:156 (+) Transcript_66263:44-511(+)|eukprot:CAMPEP_0176447382 /NCGR_PEP_ID=MMETSP0127-20121128/24987_1 /TAXON_ID=938130 /ORGANISM="Platyophrya macrostoma, Strain WH" /LENGTH=155 /DNA_ID=CAMNT_0017833795 /DNA_START=28 /DNA_END=495 /DNA_ORIENTATION=+